MRLLAQHSCINLKYFENKITSSSDSIFRAPSFPTVHISQVLGSIGKAQISQQLNQPMSQLVLGNLGDPFFYRLEENRLKAYEVAFFIIGLSSQGKEQHRFWSASHKTISSVSLVEWIRNASEMSPQALGAHVRPMFEPLLGSICHEPGDTNSTTTHRRADCP